MKRASHELCHEKRRKKESGPKWVNEMKYINSRFIEFPIGTLLYKEKVGMK